MTIALFVPSRQYAPQTATLKPSFPSGVSRIKVSLTREAWPAGAVGSVSIIRPDGSPGGAFLLSGGPAFNMDGSVATTSWFEGALQQSQLPLAAPSGQYIVNAQVLQTIDTAITVEQF